MNNYIKINSIIRDILNENGVEVFDEEHKFEIDSLTIVTIIISIEEHFNISFPDSIFENSEILCLKALTNLVCDLLQSNKEAAQTDNGGKT